MKSLCLLLFALASVIALSCSSSPVTPPTHAVSHGNWSGVLFMDTIPIGFVVDADGVKNLEVSLPYDLREMDTTVVWSFPTLTIENDSIYVVVEDGDDDYTFTISLACGFNTSDDATGTIYSVGVYQDSITISDTLDTTWSASLQR